jgi:acyl-CoA hydrolase
MRGRSVYARVNNLIAIAHPDHRAELRRQAEKLSYI